MRVLMKAVTGEEFSHDTYDARDLQEFLWIIGRSLWIWVNHDKVYVRPDKMVSIREVNTK